MAQDSISPKIELAQDYRETFSRDSRSIRVFVDILTDLGLYQTIDDEEDRHLYNAAIRMLVKMGIYDSPNCEAILRNLLQIPLAALPPRKEIPDEGLHDMARS